MYHHNYNQECGSGFYTIEEYDIATRYARQIAFDNGGEPIINMYKLHLKELRESLKTLFLNELTNEAMRYIGEKYQKKRQNKKSIIF